MSNIKYVKYNIKNQEIGTKNGYVYIGDNNTYINSKNGLKIHNIDNNKLYINNIQIIGTDTYNASKSLSWLIPGIIIITFISLPFLLKRNQ
jgi:FAD synthase